MEELTSKTVKPNISINKKDLFKINKALSTHNFLIKLLKQPDKLINKHRNNQYN
ncbi:6073_t:CDS:2 [Acaulospora colombiana]|uniref:6073_t:CDS:1 n=1 Tax=Acaulospora colombiana TaxID=27376 RepID=A0ACA9K6S0_9GLOM|nr:6073_t:CDS:2 [Acaulospora colombiana]